MKLRSAVFPFILAGLAFANIAPYPERECCMTGFISAIVVLAVVYQRYSWKS